jgi:hypothetical protein
MYKINVNPEEQAQNLLILKLQLEEQLAKLNEVLSNIPQEALDAALLKLTSLGKIVPK